MGTDKNKTWEFKDGEWYKPKMKGFIHECCDCGLKHKVDFKVFYDDKVSPIEFRWKKI